MATALTPDDVPPAVAKMAFRMYLRLTGIPDVEAFRRILAACAPLAVAGPGAPDRQPDPDAHGGNPRCPL